MEQQPESTTEADLPIMEFNKLVSSIKNTHEELHLSAVKAINQSLTVRNWLIGFYIVEFEQKGEDRAKYGDRLLADLSSSIKIKGLSVTNLRLCRQFYTLYPHLTSAIQDLLLNKGIGSGQICQSLTDKSLRLYFETNTIHQSVTDELHSQLNDSKLEINKAKHNLEILSKISFTHIVQLLPVTNFKKRMFYELECIKQA